MVTLPLDAREILYYLNELGFRNVTAEQLKEFMQDLRKLIKYEERFYVYNQENRDRDKNWNHESSNYLHKAPTVSFQAHTTVDETKSQNVCKKVANNNERKLSRKKNVLGERSSNITIGRKESKVEKISTKVDVEKRPLTKSVQQSKKSLNTTESRMWIKPKSIMRSSQGIKTKDPVQLYQYYQREWERFKQNLPGESDHSELRWRIRHKLLGVYD